jgi:peptide deformylase
MAVIPIITYPNQILKTVSAKIDRIDENILLLIKNIVETMQAHNGCVGLAAPQIGYNLRLIVVDVSKNKKTTIHHNLLILINPVISKREGTIVIREGCLSLPEFTGNVQRAAKVTVLGLDQEGQNIEIQTEGFEAIALQHEIDHLDGYLFIDRVASVKRDVFRRKLYQ